MEKIKLLLLLEHHLIVHLALDRCFLYATTVVLIVVVAAVVIAVAELWLLLLMFHVVSVIDGSQLLLALGGLLGGLGDLATGSILEVDGLDDTDSDGLSHVTDSETTQRRELLEGLNAQRLGGNQVDDGGITRLDELGVLLGGLTGTTVNLLLDLSEFASNVSGVAIQHWGVAVGNLARVVQHDDLSGEIGSALGGAGLGVTGNVATTQLLNGDVLNVETNVVTGNGLGEGFVVHLHGLNLSGDVGWGEDNNGTGLQDTSLHTTDGYCSNTANFVDILQGQTQGLVGGTGRGQDGVEGIDEGLAIGVTFLALHLPSLEPGHVGRWFQHVVAVPAGDGHEGNSRRVVADLLDVRRHFLLDFLVTGLAVWWLRRIHLVDTNNQLLDTQGESKQSVLTGLTVLGDTSLELTSTGSNNQDGTISLGGTSDHVLDEISVAGSVNDGDVVLGSLELPQGDINGDTTLTLGLQFIQNPCVLEGTLAHFLSLLLELLNGTLVDTTALVDQVTGGGGLAGIDVSNHDNVDVNLFLAHVGL